MATVGGNSRKLKSDTTDRISKLPKNLIECILEGMPLQDAVRTSAVSRVWRYNWTTISKLVFDDSFFSHLQKKGLTVGYGAKFFVSNILMLHKVPLDSFYTTTGAFNWDVIGNWILFLSRKGVKKLTLDNKMPLPRSGKLFSLPNHIFSCVELTHLNVHRYDFHVSSNFIGFPNLISLVLDTFEFETESFRSFINRCPLLESMTLTVLPVLPGVSNNLVIDSPSIKHLCIIGNLQSICIRAQALETISLDPCIRVVVNHQNEEGTMFKLLGELLRIQKLSFGVHTSELLVTDVAEVKLPKPLNCLKILELHLVDFQNVAAISAALCLIRSAPNLQKLDIRAHKSGPTTAKIPISNSFEDDMILSYLVVVKFRGVSGLDPELLMIKSILASSPSLEKMFIEAKVTAYGNEGKKISTELMRYRRASTKAEIIYSEQI